MLQKTYRSCLASALVLSISCSGWATEDQVAAAEVLFQDGLALLEAGDTDAACPKLRESQRLDAATGTLFALAVCNERSGKYATAWAQFTEAEGRARTEGRDDRVSAAHERAGALFGRLSRLTIEVPAGVSSVEGLEVLRNGVLLGKGSWNTEMPVDGGEHLIEARAPNHESWQQRVNVGAEGATVTVSVPLLSKVRQPAAATTLPPNPPVDSAEVLDKATPNTPTWGALEWIGVSAGGFGLACGGTALIAALAADAKYEDSKQYCEGDFCDSEGLRLRSEAVTRGNLATTFGVAGGVLVAAGATLFFIGRANPSGFDESQLALGVGFDGERMHAKLSGAF